MTVGRWYSHLQRGLLACSAIYMNFIHSNSHITTMENHSTSSFTNLMNSEIQSSNPQNPNTQQQPSFPPHFPMNCPPHQFGPNPFAPQYYPPNLNPFGVQQGYVPISSSKLPAWHSFPWQFSWGRHDWWSIFTNWFSSYVWSWWFKRRGLSFSSHFSNASCRAYKQRCSQR